MESESFRFAPGQILHCVQYDIIVGQVLRVVYLPFAICLPDEKSGCRYAPFAFLFVITSMLFKWLFVVFAFWWLYHALRPWLAPKHPSAPPPSATDIEKKKADKYGEYIDYEEIE